MATRALFKVASMWIALNQLMLVQLHGTCLGFEALAIIVSRDADILSGFDSYDNASPLILTEDGQSGSAFFGSLPGELLQAVQEEPLAMENHGRGDGLDLDLVPRIRPLTASLSKGDHEGKVDGAECLKAHSRGTAVKQ